MSRGLKARKAVALFMVLATLLVVVVLANAVLALVLSQTRFTLHKASRAQAFYAAQAAANYAIEQLRTGVWSAPAIGASYEQDLPYDDDFPKSINQPIKIVVSNPGIYGTSKINATVDFSYSP